MRFINNFHLVNCKQLEAALAMFLLWVYKLLIMKEIGRSFNEGGVKDLSRRRFLRRMGLLIAGGSAVAGVGGFAIASKILSNIEANAEAIASSSHPTQDPEAVRQSRQYLNRVQTNQAPLEQGKLEDPLRVVRLQNEHDEATRKAKEEDHYVEIDMARTFGPLLAIPIGAAGVGLSIDNAEPKHKTAVLSTITGSRT